MISQMLLSAGEGLLGCDSAQFDGTNDYMTRGAGLTGAADSKSGIFSVWLRLDGGNGTNMRIMGSSTSVGGAVSRWRIARQSTNVINVNAANSSGVAIVLFGTVGTYLSGTTWLNVLASWDLAAAVASLHINDVSDLSVSTLTNDTINYAVADWSIGADPNGSEKLNGCLAELYFAPGQYLDFSVTENRRKFITSGGKPVNLGADGSTPTGTAPLVYQHLNIGEAVADFETNRATGGNFSITGLLTTGSTSPSS